MTRTTKFISLLSLGAVFGLGAMVIPVFAPSAIVATAQAADSKEITDRAKTDGIVGEQADGYLGLVSGRASAEIQAAVDEINIRRKGVYTRLAREQGVSIEVVSALTAEKLIAKVPSGEYVRDGFGKWVKK